MIKSRLLSIAHNYEGTPNKLDQCIYDAHRMQANCYSTDRSIYTQLAKGTFFDLIRAQTDGLKYNDRITITYSGHGTTTPRGGAICLFDGKGIEYVLMADIRSYLETLPFTTILVFDCCYSGATISGRDGGRASARFIDYDESNPILNPIVERSVMKAKKRTTAYYMMACSDSEVAWEDEYGGVFTTNLLKSFDFGVTKGEVKKRRLPLNSVSSKTAFAVAAALCKNQTPKSYGPLIGISFLKRPKQ